MIPKPIYELLPILYIIGGLTAMSIVSSFVSLVSGLLLGISGICILCMRHNYRAEQAAKEQS